MITDETIKNIMKSKNRLKTNVFKMAREEAIKERKIPLEDIFKKYNSLEELQETIIYKLNNKSLKD